MRSLHSESDNLDPAYTCGQISGTIGLIVMLLVIFLVIDWIPSKTGWIVPFFVLSIVLLLHSLSLGIGDVQRPIKLKSGSSSLASDYFSWQGPLKLNIIRHLLSLVFDGLYFLFAASLFLKLLYLLFGGFSHATSNYWDWLLFTLYSASDQILLGAISIFHLSSTSIQATQTWQQIAVYLPNLIFALLFWASIVKFYKILTNKGTKKLSAHPEDQRLSNLFGLTVSFISFITMFIGYIIVVIFEWLMYFTRSAELGLLLSAVVLFVIVCYTVILLRTPYDKVLSTHALSQRSKREKFLVGSTTAVTLAVLYLSFAALFFQSLSLLFGGFSPATANYGDWFSFVFYFAIDQISFNAISIFHLYPGSIQATQTLQLITVFSFSLVFTLLFWKTILAFLWPNVSTTLKEQELTPVDIV